MYVSHNVTLTIYSLFFILPAIMAVQQKEWTFFTILSSVVTTSTLTHSTKNPYIILLDLAAVQALTWGTLPYYIEHNILPVWCIATVPGFLFFTVGYYTNSMIYSKNKQEAEAYHLSMHFFGVASTSLALYYGKC